MKKKSTFLKAYLKDVNEEQKETERELESNSDESDDNNNEMLEIKTNFIIQKGKRKSVPSPHFLKRFKQRYSMHPKSRRRAIRAPIIPEECTREGPLPMNARYPNLYIEYQKEEKENTTDYLWSGLYLFCNLYNFIAFFYLLGIPGSPEYLFYFFEVVTELFSVMESVGYTVLLAFFPEYLESLPLSRPCLWFNSTAVTLSVKYISSCPLQIIGLLSRIPLAQLNSHPKVFLHAIKLLRLPDVLRFLSKRQEIVKAVSSTTFEILKYLLIIVLMVHALTSIWLFVNIREENNSWSVKFNRSELPYFEQYISAMFLIITTLAGMGYGNSFPVTITEILLYSLIALCGCTFLSALFGSIANIIYIKNADIIGRKKTLQQITRFAISRELPLSFSQKLLNYYSIVHEHFSNYEDHYNLISELPDSLRGDILLQINANFIQKVKFFQQADINFVRSLMLKMKPMICLAGDYIVRKGEIAYNLYFIKKGFVRTVCADDENVIISYMSKGSYFGEIGLFITGKRSVSVIAQTNCTLFVVSKPDLEQVLGNNQITTI